MRRWLRISLFLAFLSVAAGAPAAVFACPGCKEAAFDTPEQAEQRIASAKGYGATIGMLLLVPVAMIGGIGFGVFRSVRRRPAARV